MAASIFIQLRPQLPTQDPDAPDCDYYGASLHKWLGCPLGAGILYVKKERLPGMWPLFGDRSAKTTIDKLNHTGTHPAATDLAICQRRCKPAGVWRCSAPVLLSLVLSPAA